jgi:hypothetical protein
MRVIIFLDQGGVEHVDLEHDSADLETYQQFYKSLHAEIERLDAIAKQAAAEAA